MPPAALKTARYPVGSQLILPGFSRLAIRRPDLRVRLAMISEPGEELSSLCDAYERAWRAIEEWQHSGSPKAPERVAEFRQLSYEIERIITEKLSQGV